MTELLGQVARQVEQGGYWHLNQYYRPANLLAYQALGEEVVEQFHILGGPPPQFFACSVGTGGLIQGMGTCLRRAFPGIQIVAVEPEPQTTIPGIRNTQTLYLGQDDPYDRHFPDLRRTILPPEHQAQVAGIRLGDSATAVYHAILQAAWDNALFIAPD
jgi:cysteine synthase